MFSMDCRKSFVVVNARTQTAGLKFLLILGRDTFLYLSASTFLPVRRYASAGHCDSDVSGRLSVCLSHAGIVPSRAKAGS